MGSQLLILISKVIQYLAKLMKKKMKRRILVTQRMEFQYLALKQMVARLLTSLMMSLLSLDNLFSMKIINPFMDMMKKVNQLAAMTKLACPAMALMNQVDQSLALTIKAFRSRIKMKTENQFMVMTKMENLYIHMTILEDQCIMHQLQMILMINLELFHY